MSKALARQGTLDVLTASEAQTLAAQEELIRRGMSTFVDVGNALAAIRDARLYRATHDTFEDYCRERWGMTPQHANRTIAASAVVALLEPIGSTPATESQARPLARLPAEQQPLAWQAALATAHAENRDPTAKDVTRAVATIVRQNNPKPEETQQKDPQTPDEPQEPPKPGTAMCYAAEAIQCMRKIKQSDPARANAFGWVRKWVTDHE